jgi:hypothetical protein
VGTASPPPLPASHARDERDALPSLDEASLARPTTAVAGGDEADNTDNGAEIAHYTAKVVGRHSEDAPSMIRFPSRSAAW